MWERTCAAYRYPIRNNQKQILTLDLTTLELHKSYGHLLDFDGHISIQSLL